MENADRERKVPLYDNAKPTLRAHIEAIQRGEKVPVIVIGELTEEQFNEIRKMQLEKELPLLESKEILYLGKHNYNSRTKDGYCIEDIILQIESALSPDSIVNATRGTILENPHPRIDGYGNAVNDRAVLEMTSRRPKTELFSVMPKGDLIKPQAAASSTNVA
ncbi:hypothetical protein [Cronobacter sakazakii]|uniref:hypothetical protein n=1 Tax=Cronobacter sakazakii TaxID=28141 RepID=UPI0019594908|nr:hypothetical protein [Cronobacter sakazakii]